MGISDYSPPVNQLLTIGEITLQESDEWIDYPGLYELGDEDVSELIRMVTDEELNTAWSDSLEVWAPIHALRALGQLRSEAAIAPLVAYFAGHQDEDWMMEDIPRALGMIGPAAIPAIASFIADDSHEMIERAFASNSLVEISRLHPEARTECIDVLVKQLEVFDQNDEEWNAAIIGDLAEMKATEALPLIERAFAADMVDESFVDQEDVLVLMGLKEREERPVPLWNIFPSSIPDNPVSEAFDTPFAPSKRFTINAPIKFSGKKVGGKKKSKHRKKR